MHVEQTKAKSPPIIQVLLFWPRCCRQFSGLSSYSPLMDLAPLKTRKCCAPCKKDLCQLILCFSFLFLRSFFITNILLAPSRAVTFWSAPIHALIIYSKENHRTISEKENTDVYIFKDCSGSSNENITCGVSWPRTWTWQGNSIVFILYILFQRTRICTMIVSTITIKSHS